tara:strand:+ start:123 stop:605 length:483 start_codon:yes stop_codon:yes gene_type:complete
MGEIFNLTESEIEQKLEDGWLDSPASLDLPKDNDTGVTKEHAENASPEDLVKLVESYGFFVLTPEQLKAEANKMASVVLEIDKFSDEDIIAEAEKRGLKSSDDAIQEELSDLAEKFDLDPTTLNKDELVTLGNNGYTLGLRSNMKEETLIAKITEALSGE